MAKREYRFNELLEITQLIHAYLESSNRSAKTAIERPLVRMSMHLLLREYKAGKWTFRYPDGIRSRLVSAGINPDTFKVQDKVRASWAWYQIRTLRKYSEKMQTELIQLGGTPPDINIGCAYSHRDASPRATQVQSPQNQHVTRIEHQETRFNDKINALFFD